MNKLIVSVAIFVLLGASILIGQDAPEFGQIWQKQSTEPLFTNHGDPGSWNGGNETWDWNWGHVMMDSDTFRLYLGGHDGTHYSIGMWYSTSLDSGWMEVTTPGRPIGSGLHLYWLRMTPLRCGTVLHVCPHY